MKSDLLRMTFGAELEVSDVDRRIPIPEGLGVWANTETDVINRHRDRRGLACDPLGIAPPWGGEVNARPAASVEEASEVMEGILDHLGSFEQNQPDFDAFNASHVHVRIPGFREDLPAMKRFLRYVRDNQDDVLEYSFRNYVAPPYSKARSKVHTIPLDGKRKMQAWMIDNILEHAKEPADVFQLQLRGKDAVTPFRIFRYSVNLYNLKLMDTVEFRWLRPSVDPFHWKENFRFTERFILEALNEGAPAREWMDQYQLAPEREIELEMWDAWEATRYTQERFKHLPRRQLVE